MEVLENITHTLGRMYEIGRNVAKPIYDIGKTALLIGTVAVTYGCATPGVGPQGKAPADHAGWQMPKSAEPGSYRSLPRYAPKKPAEPHGRRLDTKL